MSSTPARFDREADLRSLLGGLAQARLAAALTGLLGPSFRLCDDAGEVLLAGADSAAASRTVELCHQLDVVGTLAAADGAAERLETVGTLLELLLAAQAKLRMTADLHLQAVHEDYRVLLEKHAALTQSEARYKALSAELEQRVREQVAALERSQRQLYLAEKMASVGQLAAGVAHEVNNPIGFICSNLGTAQEYLQRLRELQSHAHAAPQLAAVWKDNDLDYVLEDFGALLHESAQGAQRVAKIVADLKTFSSIDAAEEMAFDLNEGLRATANVAQPLLAAGATLALDLQPLPRLLCHPGRINQVFLNLVQNAAQAVAAGGEIRISSHAASDRLCIVVRDNGVGIPSAVLPRIFDPFFTTREVGKGMGLGLTVARDIVLGYGGSIDAVSEPGRGTAITVNLPLPSSERGAA